MGCASREKRERRQRRLTIELSSERDLVVQLGGGPDTISFLDETGQPVDAAAIGIRASTVYDRKGKNAKVLLRHPGHPGEVILDHNAALLKYATVVAVDTNTVEIEGTRVSISTICSLTDIVKNGSWGIRVETLQPVLEFRGPHFSPERVGWACAIDRLLKGGATLPLLLIVDAYLSDLGDIIAGKQEIAPGFSKPAGVTLMYASADVGAAEFVANAAIRRCNAVATSIIDAVRKDGLGDGSRSSSCRRTVANRCR